MSKTAYSPTDVEWHRKFANGSAIVLGMRAISALSLFVISISLARLLGTEGFGQYAYITAWVTGLSVPAAMGFQQLLIREVAAFSVREQWSHLRGLLDFSSLMAWKCSGFLIIGTFGVHWLLVQGGVFFVSMYTLAAGLLTIPVLAGLQLRQATLCGLLHPIPGQITDLVLRPAGIILLIWIVALALEGELTPFVALLCILIVNVGGYLVSGTLLRKKLPKEVLVECNGYKEEHRWMQSALLMVTSVGLLSVNGAVSPVILGIMLGTEASGFYTVAAQGAALISLSMVAANSLLGPAIARMKAGNDDVCLQDIVTRGTRLTCLFAMPIAVGLLLLSDTYLALFGEEYQQAKIALNVLVASQLVNVASGAVALILFMTGNERDVSVAVVIAVVLNVLLNILLIPWYGIEGAAWASGTSLVLWNLMLVYSVYRQLGLHTSILAKKKI